MFDVSFTELLVIGVVALVVIGPERLPKVARTLGHLVGRAQRYVNDVKTDIQREVELDELRKLKDQMQDAAQSVQSSLQNTEASLRKPLESLEQDVSELKDSFKNSDAVAYQDLVEPVTPELPQTLAAAASETSNTSGDQGTSLASPSFAEAEVQAMLAPAPAQQVGDSHPTIPVPVPAPISAPTQLELGAVGSGTAPASNQTPVASSTPGSAS